MSSMFNLGALATNVLNSIDNAAKETLEEPKISAKTLRSRRKVETRGADDEEYEDDDTGPREFTLNPPNTILSGNETYGTSTAVEQTSPMAALHSSHDSSSTLSSMGQNFGTLATNTADIDLNNPDPFVMVSRESSAPSTASTVARTSSIGAAGVSSEAEANLRKQLRKKNQEIETLNRECLELEETAASLKKEVREAWDNYKQAQERHAGRESELLDEIAEIKKSKVTDKKQAVQSINNATEEMKALEQQLKEAHEEIASMESIVMNAEAADARWQEEKAYFQAELEQARASTVQGVQNLVEELRVAQNTTEQLRAEHSVLRRQSELRQQELEKETSELTDSLSSAQKEIQRLKKLSEQLSNNSDVSGGTAGNGGSSTTSGMCMNRACVVMQQENMKLAFSLEKNEEQLAEAMRLQKQYQAEARAAQLVVENEKERSSRLQEEVVLQYSSQVEALEQKLSQYQKRGATGSSAAGTIANYDMPPAHWSSRMQHSMDEANIGGSGKGLLDDNGLTLADFQRMEQEMLEVRSQAMNFSRLLMKKQSEYEDLQSERSTLKSKLMTAEARYHKAEKELSRLQDLEEGNDMADEDSSPRYRDSSAAESGGLQRRGSAGSSGSVTKYTNHADHDDYQPVRRTKVIHDLERMGVKPGARVARAVNFVDTWAILLNRTLRQYPLARLGFILYLLVLHIWVMLVLVVHIHDIELDAPSDLTNSKVHPHQE